MRLQANTAHDPDDGTPGGVPEGVFEGFFRAQFPVVVRIAYSLVRDEHLAEDIAQDVLISAQRRFTLQGDSEHAVAWVRVAAAHVALNAGRGRRRRHVRQTRLLPAKSYPSPEEVALERDQASQIRAALAKLPRHSATVLVLRHSGLSYAEVAESMGVKIGHVGTMLRRAEASLRKEFERATHR